MNTLSCQRSPKWLTDRAETENTCTILYHSTPAAARPLRPAFNWGGQFPFWLRLDPALRHSLSCSTRDDAWWLLSCQTESKRYVTIVSCCQANSSSADRIHQLMGEWIDHSSFRPCEKWLRWLDQACLSWRVAPGGGGVSHCSVQRVEGTQCGRIPSWGGYLLDTRELSALCRLSARHSLLPKYRAHQV